MRKKEIPRFHLKIQPKKPVLHKFRPSIGNRSSSKEFGSYLEGLSSDDQKSSEIDKIIDTIDISSCKRDSLQRTQQPQLTSKQYSKFSVNQIQKERKTQIQVKFQMRTKLKEDQRIRKLKQLKIEQENRENKTLRQVPQINPVSARLIQQNSLYKMYPQIVHRLLEYKKISQESRKQKLLQKKLQTQTFHDHLRSLKPKINKKSKKIQRKIGDLYSWNQKRKQNIQDLRIQKREKEEKTMKVMQKMSMLSEGTQRIIREKRRTKKTTKRKNFSIFVHPEKKRPNHHQNTFSMNLNSTTDAQTFQGYLNSVKVKRDVSDSKSKTQMLKQRILESIIGNNSDEKQGKESKDYEDVYGIRQFSKQEKAVNQTMVERLSLKSVAEEQINENESINTSRVQELCSWILANQTNIQSKKVRKKLPSHKKGKKFTKKKKRKQRKILPAYKLNKTARARKIQPRNYNSNKENKQANINTNCNNSYYRIKQRKQMTFIYQKIQECGKVLNRTQLTSRAGQRIRC